MYEQFFGLSERPFDLTPDPRFLVMTEAHTEVLSTLRYGIASRKGVTLLIGEAGLGKTTLLRAALDEQPERVHFIYIQNPVLSRTEFVELLVIDEAQSLPPELLEEVRLLANIETNSEKLLSLIIAGQPELADRLNDPALRQFKQRIALRCHLRPLSVDEATAYIAGRIAAAGGVGGRVFTREAVGAIYERSGGVPRTVSVIADNALLGGFAAGTRPVTAAVVREVCADLDLPEPEPRPAVDLFHPEAPGGEASFRMLRARVSLPRESLAEGAEVRPAERPARAVGDSNMFGAFSKKRRFLFFGRRGGL